VGSTHVTTPTVFSSGHSRYTSLPSISVLYYNTTAFTATIRKYSGKLSSALELIARVSLGQLWFDFNLQTASQLFWPRGEVVKGEKGAKGLYEGERSLRGEFDASLKWETQLTILAQAPFGSPTPALSS
jgi:hypothetical protein